MNEFAMIAAETLPPDSRAAQLQRNLIGIDAICPHLNAGGLIKGLLSTTTIAVVYGASNVGKTFFCLDMGLHLAAGVNWMKHRITKPRKVLYLAAEGGKGTQNRIVAFKIQFAATANKASGNFTLLPMPVNLIEDWKPILDALGFVPECVFIDTLHQTFEGDENASRDMGAYIAAASQIKEATGATVVIVHHTGKDNSKGARGHSSLRAAMDTEIELTKERHVILVTVTKQRDLRPAKPFAYQLNEVVVGQDEDGDDVTSCVVEACKPITRPPKLTSNEKIAMQAFADTIVEHGYSRKGNSMIATCKSVLVTEFKDMCRRHNLVDSDKENSLTVAFGRVLKGLQNKEILRVVDGIIWATSSEMTTNDSE